MKTKLIKELENGYKVVMTDYRDVDGWVSYWLRDACDSDIKSFTTPAKALRWWSEHKGTLGDEEHNPARIKAVKEAVSLCTRMGLQWKKLAKSEQEEWIAEVIAGDV